MTEQTALMSADARAVLLTLASRLESARPHRAMEEALRLALVLRYSAELRGDTPSADTLEREVLRHAPTLTGRDVSRGEYAALLRLIAQGVAV